VGTSGRKVGRDERGGVRWGRDEGREGRGGNRSGLTVARKHQ
jgi:hypothetical protein